MLSRFIIFSKSAFSHLQIRGKLCIRNLFELLPVSDFTPDSAVQRYACCLLSHFVHLLD